MSGSVRALRKQFIPLPTEGDTASTASIWDRNPEWYRAYQYMRGLETHSDLEITQGKETITLHRGQFAASVNSLYMQLPGHMSLKQTRTFIEALEEAEIIVRETLPTEKRYCSIFTIVEDAETETLIDADIRREHQKHEREEKRKNKSLNANEGKLKSSVYAACESQVGKLKSSVSVDGQTKIEETSDFALPSGRVTYNNIYKQNDRDNNNPSIDIDYSTIGLRQAARLQNAIDAAARRVGSAINATVEKYVVDNLNDEIIDSATDAQLEELVDMAIDLDEQGKL